MPTGTRCDVVDDEVADLLARSGGRSLSFAPESGSERTRQLIRKKMKTESLMRAVHAAMKAKLNLSILLVIGFPHDTAADIRETVRLCRMLGRLGVDDIACAFFFPIPATTLYDELVARGRIGLDDASLMTPIFVHDRRLTEERNFCDHLTARKLTLFKYWIVANFYGASLLARPGRPFHHLWNLVTGREASKMDTFLKETTRRIGRAIVPRLRSGPRDTLDPSSPA
jgi:radical SAM superfamily enzyme YgiQ (UPF0313 family)